VKRSIADGSVGHPHVRVGHRQASNQKPRQHRCRGFFLSGEKMPEFIRQIMISFGLCTAVWPIPAYNAFQ
jgi:hypothetical protein